MFNFLDICSYREEKFNERYHETIYVQRKFRSSCCFVDQNKMRKQKFNRAKMLIRMENLTFYSEMYLNMLKQF